MNDAPPTVADSRAEPVEVVAVVKRNTTGYLHALFDLYQSNRIALPVDEDEFDYPAGVTVAERLDVSDATGWFTRHVPPRHDDAHAQIAFSSGTTGKPKALMLSHRALSDVVARLIEITRLDGSVREYVGVPVTFSFGFGRIRTIAAIGGEAYIPPHGFRADDFAAMLERGEVNALSAVPTLLRILLARPALLDGPGRKLRWLEIGSQFMSADEKRRVRDLFPNARIVQHYGLTEASRTSFLVVSDPGAELNSVGTPIGDTEVRIDANGRICIRGPHLATGLVTAQGIAPITDAEGWLTTGDLGHWQAGQLYFDGRADDQLNIGGVKVGAELFEREILGLGRPMGEIAVTGIPDDLLGQKLAIASTSVLDIASGSALRQAAAAAAARHKVAEAGLLFVAIAKVPRTDTGKVRRKLLSEEVARRAGEAENRPGHDTSIAAIFDALFGAAAGDRNLSFTALNGDSISYVRTQLALEAILPHLPADWSSLPQADLIALAAREPGADAQPETRRAGKLPANLDSMRGLACILIVAVHVVGVSPADGLELAANSPWHRVMQSLEFIRLPLFTCLAGILYGAMPARTSWSEYTWRRVWQLGPVLVFATAVYWLLRRWTYGVEENLLMAYVDGYLHLWYLDAFLLIVAFVAAVDVLSKRQDRLIVAVTAGMMGIYFVMPHLDILHVRNAVYLLPFFVFGVMLYRHPRIWQSSLALPLAVAIALVQPLTLNLGWAPGGTPLEAALTWLSGASVAVVLIRLLPDIPPLSAVAAYSFTIYLWHPAAGAAVRNALLALEINSIPLLFVVALAAGVVGPIVIHRLAERLPRFGFLLKG